MIQAPPTFLPSVSSQQRTLKETNDRPIFSVVDISYDDYTQDLPIFGTEVFNDGIQNELLGGESEKVTPRSTLVTFPIFVIGFSGTIVVCGVWMLFSEFWARRKPERDVMTKSSNGTCKNMKSSDSSAQPSSQSNSSNSRSSVLRGIFLRNGSNASVSDKEKQFTDTPKYVFHGCGNNNLGGDGQSFPWDKHLHRDKEILFYRSEDSSMSFASTITESLPSQSRSKNMGANYGTDSPTQCNRSRDCKIMELTDIHRVSTDMALEDLVELSAISATGITIASKCSDMAVIQDEVAVMNLRGADIDDYYNDVRTKEDTPSRFVMQGPPGRDLKNSKKYILSDFNTGNLDITEVMENEDCSYFAKSDNNGDDHIQEESAVENVDKSKGMDETKDAERESCISTNTTTIPPTSVSSSDEGIQVTTDGNTGSLNTVSSAEEVESPSTDFVSGEHSLFVTAKENRNIEVESDHIIVQLESGATDSERSSGFAEAFKRRGCGDWVDFVRSSSSTSIDDLKKSNSKSQEGQVCQEEDNYDDAFHLKNEIKDEPGIE